MSTHPLRADEDDVNSVLASGVFVQSSIDLDRFRNERGEFKRWLQVFYLETEREHREPYFRVTHVLPWLSDSDTVDLEFHRAASALGAYDKYPLVWRSMRWSIFPHGISPHYSLFTSNTSRGALEQSIAFVTGRHPGPGVPWRNQDFWKALERFVLVPAAGGYRTPQRLITQPME